MVAESFKCINEQKAFFDIKVFNPFSNLMSMHHSLNVMNRASEGRMNMESRMLNMVAFVFSTSGALSPTV